MSLIHRQAMHKKAGYPSTVVVRRYLQASSASSITATLGFSRNEDASTFRGGHNLYAVGTLYTSNTFSISLPAFTWLGGIGSGANNYQANARFISKTTAGTITGSTANTWLDIGTFPTWSLTISTFTTASLRMWFQFREKIDGTTTTTKLISNVYAELYCQQVTNTTGTPCPFCCFTPDTPITMADMTTKRIVDVCVGDYILSYNPDIDENVPCEVTGIIVREYRNMYKIEFDNGRSLNSSDDHPIWTKDKGFASINPNGEYKDLGVPEKLCVGDFVIDQEGKYTQITSISEIYYPYKVYTFENPRFYANGILVY